MRSVRGPVAAGLVGLVVVAGSLVAIGVAPAGATSLVHNEAEFRAAWTNNAETEIDLANDITFTTPCANPSGSTGAVRATTTPLTVNGNGHTLTLCTNAGNGVLEQDSSGALTFQNVTVTGGTATTSPGIGGAIFTGGVVTVTNSTFTNNTADGIGGGAIFADGAAVTVTNSTFTGNTAPGDAGGAVFAFGVVTVTNSTFTNNTAAGSGAIFDEGGAVTVTNSTFTGNTAPGGTGGAIVTGGVVTVTNSTFANNTASSGGGAIGTGNAVMVTNSTFTGNAASSGDGGAITGAAVTVTNSTFTGNAASSGDGGAIGTAFPVTVTNSTFTNNTASTGGAVFASSALKVAYSTLTGNVAPTGSAVASDTSITLFGSVFVKPAGTGPLCAGTSNSLGYNYANETLNTCNLIATGDSSLDANDPLLGALASNGGPTQTQLPQDGPSPLIDAIPNAHCGDGNTLAGFTITTDQRGLPRPDTASPNCDIGAVEVQPPAAATTTTTPGLTAAFTG